jgi:hypothetical protein
MRLICRTSVNNARFLISEKRVTVADTFWLSLFSESCVSFPDFWNLTVATCEGILAYNAVHFSLCRPDSCNLSRRVVKNPITLTDPLLEGPSCKPPSVRPARARIGPPCAIEWKPMNRRGNGPLTLFNG